MRFKTYAVTLYHLQRDHSAPIWLRRREAPTGLRGLQCARFTWTFNVGAMAQIYRKGDQRMQGTGLTRAARGTENTTTTKLRQSHLVKSQNVNVYIRIPLTTTCPPRSTSLLELETPVTSYQCKQIVSVPEDSEDKDRPCCSANHVSDVLAMIMMQT